jgi:hypothetical protein
MSQVYPYVRHAQLSSMRSVSRREPLMLPRDEAEMAGGRAGMPDVANLRLPQSAARGLSAALPHHCWQTFDII